MIWLIFQIRIFRRDINVVARILVRMATNFASPHNFDDMSGCIVFFDYEWNVMITFYLKKKSDNLIR